MDMLVVTNFVSKGNIIFLNNEPRNNQLSINNIDYYAYSVSPQSKRNKGAHSYVLALYPSQDFIDIYKSQPQKVIKISNVRDFFRDGDYVGSDANERFRTEISALEVCKRKHIPNIIEIDASRICTMYRIIQNKKRRRKRKERILSFLYDGLCR